MSVSILSRRSTVSTRLIALLCALLLAILSLALLPQQGYAAVGDTFTEKLQIGDKEVDCTFKITGANTVQIGEGGFDARNTGDYSNYYVESANPALPKLYTQRDSESSYVLDAAGAVTIPGSVRHDGTTYTVTGIASGAFYKGVGITNIELPSSITYIGAGAFAGCEGLNTITMPAVTEIPECCFAGCSALRGVEDMSDVTSIGNSAFRGCNAIHSMEIPSRVTTIGACAFFNCKSLESVTMRNAVTSVGAYAFGYCSGLETITLSTSLAELPESMFAMDYALTTVNNTSQITSLGVRTFSQCSGLREFTIPERLSVIPESCFENTGLTSITIPSGVEVIGDSAFKGCNNLRSVTFPVNGSCKISFMAFANCKALETLNLSGVSELTESYNMGSQFQGCTSLTSVNLGSQITEISDGAFYNCPALTSIAFPSQVTSLDDGSFGQCTGLNSVTIPSTLTALDNETFEQCYSLVAIVLEGDTVKTLNYQWSPTYEYEFTQGFCHIYVPDDLVAAYKADSNWAPMADYILPVSQKPADTNIYALLKTDGTLVQCNSSGTAISGGKEFVVSGNASSDYAKYAITQIKFQSGLTSIPLGAFAYCKALQSVSLPAGITSIGQTAFYECSALQSVSGNGVTSVEYRAFDACRALRSVGFMNKLANLEAYAFQGCSALESVSLKSNLSEIGTSAFSGCTNLSEVTLPTSASYFIIGDSAFNGCTALQSISIPSQVAQLGESAFANSGLTSVNAPGVLFSMGTGVFQNCRQLTSASASYVQGSMFKDCTALRSVTFNNTNEIYSSAFSGCTALQEISFPSSVSAIDEYAFANCTGLWSIQLPEGITSLSSAFHNCTGLISVHLPGSLYSVSGTKQGYSAYGAFSGCSGISNVTFGDGYEANIGGAMFYGCTALRSLDIPDSVVSLDSFALKGCLLLRDLHLPSSLAYLGDDSIAGCLSLTSIDLSFAENLEIDTYSGGQLAGCYNLESVALPSSLGAISPAMFAECINLTQITVPAGVDYIGSVAFRNCTALETVIFDNDCSACEYSSSYGEIFSGCDALAKAVFRSKKPQDDALSFPEGTEFYYTVSYYPLEELASDPANCIGQLTVKAGTDVLGTSAPAASAIFDGEWIQATAAESAITASSLSDSGWALPGTWKGVLFITQPQNGETPDGSFTLSAEARVRQVSGGVPIDLSTDVSYTWYACDARGNISDSTIGTGAELSLASLNEGKNYFICVASSTMAGLDRSSAYSQVVCVSVKSGRMSVNPGTIIYRWALTDSNRGTGPTITISNDSGFTVKNIKWRSQNGYFEFGYNSQGSWGDVDAGVSFNTTMYPKMPNAEPGEYHDTLIISSDNATTLEVPVTLVFFDDSEPYAYFAYTASNGTNWYGTTVDFGTLEPGYTNPQDNYGNQCTIYGGGGGVNMTGRTNPTHFTIYNESIASFPQFVPSNYGYGLKIAPKAGLAPGTYEDTFYYTFTSDGASRQLPITLRVTVGSPGGIAVSPTSCDWGSVREGYDAQAVQTITVTNYEDEAITLPTNIGSSLQAFTVDGAAGMNIPAGESRTFRVAPKTGLAPGTYSETLTIAPSGLAAKSVALSFEVTAIEPVTATVSFTAQMSGGFFHAPQFNVEVSSDLAESYGYADSVPYGDNVSALDVLVAAHVLTFGSDFTPETAADYLAMSSGYMTTFFGWNSNDYSGGFFLNHAMANDGTESQWGGYNGTTVDTQPVSDGDLLEFFFYEDEDYLDTYNWFVDMSGNPSREFSTISGGTLELALMGCPAMSGYLFKDADEMMASSSAEAVSDAQVAIVDLEDGTLYELDDAITDENGLVSLSFDEPGNYIITAYGTEDCECAQIMSLTTVKVTAPKPGWNKIDGDWYYFDEDGDMVTSTWKKDSKGWCYLGEDGRMVTNGWAKDSKGWCWIGDSGYMVVATKWIKVDGVWYHITNGYRDANKWMKDGTRWCYLGADGTMVKSTWKKDSKGWCYLDASGYMLTNAFAPDSKGQCWLGSDGYMVVATKWIKYDGDWYHITSGYMDKSKWMKDSKGWCWLQADGKMLTNGFAKDSKGMCYIASDGYMPVATKWVKVDGVWYHITNGYMDTSKWFKDSKGWCYVGADGKMVTEGWAKDSKGWCWLDAAGYMPVETKWIGEPGAEGSSYIINGYRVDNQTIDIGGTEYTFDSDGKLVL
ncbi:MAG: leucine-rich repeat protein [bacterium]|nr:leucine-rich repeat protein [bacterium]